MPICHWEVDLIKKKQPTMSMPAVIEDEEDDDVEFVSEGPLRPVLDCIDLLSDDAGDDDEGVCTVEDKVDRQKAQAASTLDRLARQVAVEKKERAEKCKAFKEKIISSQAHGRHELAVSHSSSEDSRDAKRCVDIWLKMPGLKPGVINSSTSWRRRSAPVPSLRSGPHTCPVINCGRVYDNMPLLEGHLKRFDHSPCDPTITLKGNPACAYACVACGKHFDTKESWKTHVDSKISSSNPTGHVSSQTCQMIVCFACPACYLLFNIRDECLQHMSSSQHFAQSICLSDVKSPAVPVPIPRYAKNRLIALCKDVAFTVKCTSCSKVLTSHMDAKAHFNVRCRQGCALAEADQSVAQVMKQMTVLGHCSTCFKVFLRQRQIEEHREQTQHKVEMLLGVEQALLVYSNYCEIRHNFKAIAHASKRTHTNEAPEKLGRSEKELAFWSPAKRQKLSGSGSQNEHERTLKLAWFCECGLRFLEEDQASRHLLAANQIFHKCAVCGKLMGESSIARLHMSRFHGGAHLSNFLLHCRRCKVEMPRLEDILAHVGATHQGHTYYREREDTTVETVPTPSPKPSTSASVKKSAAVPRIPPPKPEERWLCRMCEDLFDSEAAVRRHCADFASHSFQRFACGHCPQKFFKDSTLRRHCANEHDNQLRLHYFCGLCDSMLYDSEQEFLEHYASLHGTDYYCLERTQNGTTSASTVELPTTSKCPSDLCSCMGSQNSKEEQKSTFTRCMKHLAAEGKCGYACRHCAAKTASYAEMKTHMYLKHEALGKDKSFDVVCAFCSEVHRDVPSFHAHYHAQHCSLEPCLSSRSDTKPKEEICTAKILSAEEILPDGNAEEYQDIKNAISSIDVPKEDEAVKESPDVSDDDMKLALALSAEEASKTTEFDLEMEQALKRSMEDF